MTWTTAIDEEDGCGFTCDACADARCAMCGHDPSLGDWDCCNSLECLVFDAEGRGSKTHVCIFTACPEHRPPG
jgi:hypothetical protein